MKKIIWLAHEGNCSGANLALLEYMEALRSEFSFHVVLPSAGTMVGELEQRGIPYSIILQYGWTQRIRCWQGRTLLKLSVRSVVAIKALHRLIKKEQADLVFTNTITAFTAAIASRLCRKPHVWWIHEFGEEDFGFRIGWGRPRLPYRLMAASSRLLIGNSQAIVNKFKTRMPGTNLQCIYQPVSWNGEQRGEAAGRNRFLMFGQVIPGKGHKDVLLAFAEARLTASGRRNTLHIIGPTFLPAYVQELRDQVRRYGLEDCVQIRIGYYRKEEILPGYGCLIVASVHEAFGRVIVEAGKAGLPVLVKNSGGAPELVNGTNGYLYNRHEELVDFFKAPEARLSTLRTGVAYDEASEIKKLKLLLSAL